MWEQVRHGRTEYSRERIEGQPEGINAYEHHFDDGTHTAHITAFTGQDGGHGCRDHYLVRLRRHRDRQPG
jgi:hypothetical protein